MHPLAAAAMASLLIGWVGWPPHDPGHGSYLLDAHQVRVMATVPVSSEDDLVRDVERYRHTRASGATLVYLTMVVDNRSATRAYLCAPDILLADGRLLHFRPAAEVVGELAFTDLGPHQADGLALRNRLIIDSVPPASTRVALFAASYGDNLDITTVYGPRGSSLPQPACTMPMSRLPQG